jgi:UDP-2,4-diacetamido-2,4,6-trideoxy-beta-L-altropyranose hydrolase
VRIVIRVDASVFIGSGHVMRCLVLAKQLSSFGFEVIFATKPQKGDFLRYISQQGFVVLELNQSKKVITPSSSDDYLAWLQGSWEDDAKDFVLKTKSADLIIVDHYSLDVFWEREVSNKLHCKVIVIDDLVREHYADLIIDQTYGRKAEEYSLKNSKSIILVGSEFALVSPDFKDIRDKLDKEKNIENKKNILVSMGGIDSPNVTIKVLEKLAEIKVEELNVTVLLGEKSPHYKIIHEFCFNRANFNHIPFSDGMADLMSTQRIAIGAPGSTTWERACVGLPSILIPIADNQKVIAKNISQTGAVCLLNISDIEESFHDLLSLIFKNWDSFHQANLRLCDGKGLAKVCQHIINMLEKD